MRTSTFLLGSLLFMALSWSIWGCGGGGTSEGVEDVEDDSASDSDVDGNADSDSGGDSDTDTDIDTGTDEAPVASCDGLITDTAPHPMSNLPKPADLSPPARIKLVFGCRVDGGRRPSRRHNFYGPFGQRQRHRTDLRRRVGRVSVPRRRRFGLGAQ